MFDLLIGTVVVKDAADVATWCFNAGAERGRVRQAKVIQGTEDILEGEWCRQRGFGSATYQELHERRQRQWETQQGLGQKLWEGKQAAHQNHCELLDELSASINEMSGGAGKTLEELESIKRENMDSLENSALAPGQRAAIMECNDQLERGISKIQAYIGSYLQIFRDGIEDARRDPKEQGFSCPDMPMPMLPPDFPFRGELMGFDAHELEDYPIVGLGYGQKGRFVHPPSFKGCPGEPVIGMVQSYDKEEGCWLLSQAKGELAHQLLSGDAYRIPSQVFLAENESGHRVGWIHHPSGERLPVRLGKGELSPVAWNAPWGTALQVYLHTADFYLEKLEGGEAMAWEHVPPGCSFPCRAQSEFWDAYESSLDLSGKLLIRQAGMAGDPDRSQYILRLANSMEFPLGFNLAEGTVEVGPQCGNRLGVVEEGGRGDYADLFYVGFVPVASGGTHPPAELEQALQESFRDQEVLTGLQGAAELELRNYMAVLHAQVRNAPKRKRKSMEFSNWEELQKEGSRRCRVKFSGNGHLPPYLAVCLQGEEQPLGWVVNGGKPGGPEVNITMEARKQFQEREIPRTGVLEAYPVDRSLVDQIGVISDFMASAADEHFLVRGQAAFRILMQELFGVFTGHLSEPPALKRDRLLDKHQSRAVSLLAGKAPLVLVQAPPGTGKTHVISHGIARVLGANPMARVMITSPSHEALDKAVAKIQGAFPDQKIFRYEPKAAKKKHGKGKHGVGLDNSIKDVQTSINEASTQTDPDLDSLASWLHGKILEDPDRLRMDLVDAHSRGGNIVACTLGELAKFSRPAPPFDLVILDDAAKASLPEAMLAVNCAQRLALVGDHKQLLPFMDDTYYEHSTPGPEELGILKELWDNSLFSRLWEQAPASRKSFLATTSRSRKPIAQCISHCFYEGTLQPRRKVGSRIFPTPVSLFWVDSGHTKHKKQESICNPDEAKIVLNALEELHGLAKKPFTSAAIAFHRGQAELLNRMASSRKGIPKPDILTVDASQGRQWDVVVLSLARAQGTPGFVGNPNRLNLALSRAKEICVLVGSKGYVEKSWLKESALPDVLRFFQQEPKEGKLLVGVEEDGTLHPTFGQVPQKKQTSNPPKSNRKGRRGGRRKK